MSGSRWRFRMRLPSLNMRPSRQTVQSPGGRRSAGIVAVIARKSRLAGIPRGLDPVEAPPRESFNEADRRRQRGGGDADAGRATSCTGNGKPKHPCSVGPAPSRTCARCAPSPAASPPGSARSPAPPARRRSHQHQVARSPILEPSMNRVAPARPAPRAAAVGAGVSLARFDLRPCSPWMAAPSPSTSNRRVRRLMRRRVTPSRAALAVGVSMPSLTCRMTAMRSRSIRFNSIRSSPGSRSTPLDRT